MTSTGNRPRPGAIARLLARSIDSLVADLLPAGKREGREWFVGSVAGEPSHSLGVHLTGAKAGIWSDFATGDSGDALDLVRAVLDIDMAEALRWSRCWLGIDDDKPEPGRGPKTADNVSRFPGGRAARPPEPPADDDVKAKQARALDVWREAVDSIVDTPAEAYLRSRGLDPARLSSLWGAHQWPATLRYSEYAALDPARLCRALIIAVHDADCGLVRAIQRILLHPDGTAVLNENGRKRKLSLGPIAGNAARFDYWPDPAGRWGIAEGCESALSAYVLTGIPTWAAISSGNMARVVPPSWARHATIFADHDVPGINAAAEILHWLRMQPHIETVRIIGAAIEGEDAADVLCGGRLHA